MVDGNAQNLFVGRKKEQKAFEQWLINRDAESPRILSLYDEQTDTTKKGGVGKTSLMHRFQAIALRELPEVVTVYIDFFNIADRDSVVIAQHVVMELKKAYRFWNTPLFDKALAQYNSAVSKGIGIVEKRGQLGDVLARSLQELQDQLRSKNRSLSVLLFFDTYEQIEQNPMTSVLLTRQHFPDTYDLPDIRFIIAGRNALDFQQANWRESEKNVQQMPLATFTKQEVDGYFEQFSDVNPSTFSEDDLRKLYVLTEGRPILISLVKDLINLRKRSLNELVSVSPTLFRANLISKISGLEKPIDIIILFMAHAFHRFNFELLDWILQEPEVQFGDLLQNIDQQATKQELLQLSFVRRPHAGEDFVLHDEMVPLVNFYGWEKLEPGNSFRALLSRCMVRYYEHELQQNISAERKQAYEVELLYHKLYLNLQAGWSDFTATFEKAVSLFLKSFARSLLREVKRFAAKLSAEQRYTLELGEASLLLREERAEEAFEQLLSLEKKASQQWLEKYRAELLAKQGEASQQLNRYDEAITRYEPALDLIKQQGDRKQYAQLLNRLGFAYEKQGELEIALSYYENALKIQREELHEKRPAASTLLNISTVYLLQGKSEEALRQAKTSLRIRSELLEQEEISRVYVGWTHYTIGCAYYQLDETMKAQEAFEEADDIFTGQGFKEGLAAVHNRLGELAIDRGDLLYVYDWFESAAKMSKGIAKEPQIESFDRRGRYWLEQKDAEKALEFLHKAAMLARETHDNYHLAESLVDLTEALRRSGRQEEAHQNRQEARNICETHHYYRLLGLANFYEADALFEAKDYRGAFRLYAEACSFMRSYNNIEYRKAVRKLMDAGLNTPSQELIPLADELIADWKSWQLEEKYPEFIAACEELKSFGEF